MWIVTGIASGLAEEVYMGISGISSVGGANYYGAIAGGSRINRAADDASGSAIHEKFKSQDGALKAQMDNIKDGESALNVADGSLSSITDYLQSIKSLAVKASNSLYTREDKQAIQDEIDQYKQGIADVAENAQFNTKNLLDGSFSGVDIVTGPAGEGKDVSIGNSTLESLGIADFDVTGDFDISKIDEALEKVGSTRSKTGADTNALISAYNYSAGSLEQVNSSDSRLADLDIPKAVSDLKKQQLLDDIAVQMQARRQRDEEANSITKLLP